MANPVKDNVSPLETNNDSTALTDTLASKASVSANELIKQEDDEDRDFLGEDFFDNLAVLDSCYSDEENESISPTRDSSNTSDKIKIEEDKKLKVKIIEQSKKTKSLPTCKDVNKEGSKSKSSSGKESDKVYVKNETAHTRSKVSNKGNQKMTRSKDQSQEALRSKEHESKNRKSSDRHVRGRSSKDQEGKDATYNASRSRTSTDERKRLSRDHDTNTQSDRTSSRYPYERSSDKRYDRTRYRQETSEKNKPESSSTSKITTQTSVESKGLKTLLTDDLVPPGTEDVKLPKPITDESPVVETEQRSEKQKRTSQDSNEYRKRKRSSPEAMTRDRVVEDQDRMSRELSMERLRARSRGNSRERREVLRTSTRLKRELESVKRRNELINEELQRNRDKLLREQNLRRKRRRSISSERFTSRSGRRYSQSKDHSGRPIELSPISGGRMSRHSDEFSFVLSPEQYEHARFDQRERRRSFSPISSASSMISLSSEEGRGSRKRRKRSPFWKEMERKLGIKMLSGRTTETPPLQAQYPLMQVDVSAPPPGVYPMTYPNHPMPGPCEVFPPPICYDNRPLYFPTVEPMLAPTSVPRVLRVVAAEKKPISFRFKAKPLKKPISSELPEAPPPPQISAPPADSKMSLSSLLEASLKEGASPGGLMARCEAAIAALHVDNVLSVITSGRFNVRPAVVPPGALYSAVRRFDHPAQESMVKLKSPLLRSSVVKLAYTTPPKTKVAQPKPAVKPAVVVVVGNTQKQTVAVAEPPAVVGKETIEAHPIDNNATTLADEFSDSEIEFLGEVPKAVNVIATLDLEEEKPAAEVWSAQAVVEETSDISEAELMSDISLSEGDMDCVSCQRRSKIKMANASTQYSKNCRSVETQVDFDGSELQGGTHVQTRRAKKRNMVRQVLEGIDDTFNLQSVQSMGVPNTIQFQKGSETLKTSNTPFKSFSFVKDATSNTKNVPSVNPSLPLSSGLSLQAGVLSNPLSDSVSKPATGGALFKQSFQSVPAMHQMSIFGGNKPSAPTASSTPRLPVQPNQPQKSILKPSQPLQSSSLPLFGGTLLQPSAPALPGQQTLFPNTQQSFKNLQTSYPSFQTMSFPFQNPKQCPPKVQQPFPNTQQTFSNLQQFPNNPTFSGNQTSYPGFQPMYPNAGNNNNQVSTMVPIPTHNSFGQQQHMNPGQGQPYGNSSQQSNMNQNYFQNKF